MFDSNTVVCFGVGINFFSYLKRLDTVMSVATFSDNNSSLWGKRICYDNRVCINPQEINQLINPIVIIMVDNTEFIRSIEQQLSEMGVPCFRVKDILNQIDYLGTNIISSDITPKIHKFIDLTLEETTVCNFHCSYCVIWRKQEFEGKRLISNHSIDEIVSALSLTRLGGVCFVNICAKGETLLAQNITLLVRGLLEEGHYVSVVTNGTISKTIDELLNLPVEIQRRLFFKLSFHYLQLKQRQCFPVFWNNVHKIKNSFCSYTLEVVPSDDIIENIADIKEMFIEEADGVFPHVSFARDSKKEGLDLLSENSLEEYIETWKQFDSKMFELKSRYYYKKITDDCYAGHWSYIINLGSGNIKGCYRQAVIGNIYDLNMKSFPVMPTGCNCKMPYCFNNHAFLTWGVVPKIQDYSYLDMRDRVDADGKHWVKEPINSFMSQKLYDTNYAYLRKWSDYEKLFQPDRKSACIVFNSADYNNMGDIVIAHAERKFLVNYFAQNDIVEISCTQYRKERDIIFDHIMPEDIIFITGGGNIGNMWLNLNDATCDIINSFHTNTIVIMPQTIYFEENSFGEKERKTFFDTVNSHGKVILCSRDKKTYAACANENVVHRLLVPDMAMYLRYEKEEKCDDKVLFCVRNDGEALKWDFSKIALVVKECYRVSSIDYIDRLPVFSVDLDNRQESINYIFTYLSKYKLVVTDRLHCMLLCAIVGTPCIALDNISSKVSGSYEWISELPYIEFVKDEGAFEYAIKNIRKNKKAKEKLYSKMKANFASFASELKDKLENM